MCWFKCSKKETAEIRRAIKKCEECKKLLFIEDSEELLAYSIFHHSLVPRIDKLAPQKVFLYCYSCKPLADFCTIDCHGNITYWKNNYIEVDKNGEPVGSVKKV